MVDAAKSIESNSKTLLDKEKYEIKSKDIISFKEKYVITILREEVTREDHLQRVELSKNNLSKGLSNWEDALGKSVVVTNLETNESITYKTISDAAGQLNVSRRTLSRRIEDKKVFNKLYRISYASL